MPNVTHDDRSFLVDGQRIWLVSGEVHYYRMPAALWRDRLLKARRGGLNCISTYVAWNYHEPQEGRWDTSGDKDLAGFIRMAGELGLYVILRPGPYIGADWDFGGLPAWLTTKTGIAYRTNNAAYTHYFDKYFQNMLPRLAELQVSRGGNILLVQNESGYTQTTMPDRLSYLEFISQLLRRSGFDIPILTCNGFSDPPLADSIECATCGADGIQRLKVLRRRQPGDPMVTLEFSTGGRDTWGGEHRSAPAAHVARRAMEVLGCGSQINYFMYCGGTNFGFWAGRQSESEAAYATTSYDNDAPIAEGGGLTEKYYLLRPVNLLAQHMGRFLASCTGGPPPASVHDSTAVLNLSGPNGSWAFLTNNGRDDIQTVRICLPEGKELTVPLGRIGAAAVPYDLVLDDKVLQWANLTPLGMFGQRTLAFHGPAGWNAELCVNGKALQALVPAGDEPAVLEHEGLRVVLVNTELATRTWFVEDTLVFGPRFVGATLEDIEPAPGGKHLALLPMDEKLTRRKMPNPRLSQPAPPRLRPWRRIAVCTEPVASELTWQAIDRPLDVDRLGLHQGYVWYRLTWTEPRARKRSFFLPDCQDRATVYLNGALVGTWGDGNGAQRTPITALVQAGANVMTFLADNLGRMSSGWRLGESKGLYGPLYDAKELTLRKPKRRRLDKFPRRVVPRSQAHLIGELEHLPVWELDFDLMLPEVMPVHVAFSDVPFHMAALCNDRVVGFFPCYGRNFGDLTLTAGLVRGRNALQLLAWGQVTDDIVGKLRFHGLAEPIEQDASWGYRPWQVPAPGGPVMGKDQPAWYAADFTWSPPPHSEPLFLHVAAAHKGQILLNGRNLGRFWTIGPQQYYYLPDCWLAAENELMLFVERGDLPRRTRLEYRPQGPYRP